LDYLLTVFHPNENRYNPWQSLFESLEQFSDDFMTTRDQPPLDVREAFKMQYLLDTNICIYLIK